MQISIIVFDGFTDIDVVLPWDLLSRVRAPGWSVRLLAGLGLLAGKRATTYPTAQARLAQMGVEVVEAPVVREGNVATAAGCLAAQHLAGWVVETALGPAERRRVRKSIQPVGEGLSFADEDKARAAYAAL
jgi:putative intracellular protease/amidase